MFIRLRSSALSSVAALALGLSLLGCSSDDATGDPDPGAGGSNSASFDVTGTWTGTAVDDNTSLAVTVVFDNNGGANGSSLAGTLKLEGFGDLKFSGGFIDPSEGAARVMQFEASDKDGFLYKLAGSLSAKRLDEGQLTSTNPAAGVDLVFLKTTLVKQ